MITRQQYMNGSGTENHRKYYSQFVNEQVKNEVLRYIGKEALLNSKDEHLNDIPMKKWDSMSGFAFSPTNGDILMKPTSIVPIEYKLLKEAGEGVSCATLVCIYKEAGKQIIEANA